MEPTETNVADALARLNARAWGIAGGLTLGLGLLGATWLLLIIGPTPGAEVGQTLGQLRYFFPGYTVTPIGGGVGFVYGFVIGYGIGRAVGSLYNKLVDTSGQ